jgi:hypothetical protein
MFGSVSEVAPSARIGPSSTPLQPPKSASRVSAASQASSFL